MKGGSLSAAIVVGCALKGVGKWPHLIDQRSKGRVRRIGDVVDHGFIGSDECPDRSGLIARLEEPLDAFSVSMKVYEGVPSDGLGHIHRGPECADRQARRAQGSKGAQWGRDADHAAHCAGTSAAKPTRQSTL